MKKLVIALVIFLSACQTMGPGPLSTTTVDWVTRSEQLSGIQSWHVVGALGVRNEHKAWNSTVHWRQKNKAYDMSFVAPLGQGKMHLEGVPGDVRLTTTENKVLKAATPESLLKKSMGWNIPVSALFYWVRGVPVPQTKAKVQFDQYQHIKRMEQSGWVIEYQRYATVKGIDLPGKISMTKWPMRLKFVIKQWNI